MKAISLFSSSGIGDLGLRANDIETVIGCELVIERAKLFAENFPKAKCFIGDIWDEADNIIKYYSSHYDTRPFVVLATPPCQGMSSNGMGKLLSDYRKGLRPKMDERNRLIIPAIKIVKSLQPEWVILENVANMTNTMILDENENLINIIEYIKETLKDNYVGHAQVIDTADYGVPQNRKRLITILTRNTKGKEYFKKHNTFFPPITHSKDGNLLLKRWVTLRDAICNTPALEAKKGLNSNKSFHELHKVPLLDNKKYFWVSNTKEGDTAFNNQCINPSCGYQNNAKHGAKVNKEGINKYSKETPLYCEKCGELLPRPWVEEKSTGTKRLMKGYVSAYKRMKWDEPASTLTQNFQYVSSDNKIHPEQNRVLSIYEGLILQTINQYPFKFHINGKLARDGLIRDTIGESVPPKIIDIISDNIINISQE